MTPAEKQLTATLLELASEQFSNNTSNDFDLAKFFSDKVERDQLVIDVYAEEYGPAEEVPFVSSKKKRDWRLGDWQLMDAMARRLRREAEAESV